MKKKKNNSFYAIIEVYQSLKIVFLVPDNSNNTYQNFKYVFKYNFWLYAVQFDDQ